MSSIFQRLDELERVQQEILAALRGDIKTPFVAHTSPTATYSELVVDDVPNNATTAVPNGDTYHNSAPNLVERVVKVIVRIDGHHQWAQRMSRAAILEIADWCEENYFEGFAAKLRSQVEP